MPTETINHPVHYQEASQIGRPILKILLPAHLLDRECIGVIEQLHCSFSYGSALKYLWRAGNKGNAAEDLQKSRWYLNRILDARADDGNERELAKIRKAVRAINEVLS